jgi:hypothetical protein
MIMTGLTPLMFAAKKKAVTETSPTMLKEDTEANREKAVRFLFKVMPFKTDGNSETLKGLQEEFVDFFKESGDYELKDIQTLIRQAQSTNKSDQQKTMTSLISIAREMGYSLEQD